MVEEDTSRRTIALSVKAGKLTARALAVALAAAGRKIQKAHREAQTPHGRQSVKKLMAHGAATNSIKVAAPREFDRVARKWNVDYSFHQTGPDKYLLFFKAGQADAITACFADYSKRVLQKSKNRVPIRDQLKRAAEQVRQQHHQYMQNFTFKKIEDILSRQNGFIPQQNQLITIVFYVLKDTPVLI